MLDRNTPAGVTFSYAVFAALWIVASGFLLTLSFNDPHTLALIEIGKGLAFVALTSALLYLLLRRWHAALLATQQQLQATLEALPDLLFELDLDGHFLAFHSPHTGLLAVSSGQILGKTLRDALPPEVAEIGFAALREADASGFSHGKQYELALVDGKHWFEISVARKPPAADQPARFIVLARDITRRKTADAAVARLSKLYEALSLCNQAILRSADENDLFPAICRDAVEYGGMNLACIYMLGEDGKSVEPVASYGDGIEHLQEIHITAEAGQPGGMGPTGTAIREGKPVWIQDFRHAPETALWHELAAKVGLSSSAAIPLRRKGRVVGALALYSDQLDAFDRAEQNLLLEMGMDISFALDHFADVSLHRRAEELIRAQSANMSALLEVSQELISTLDLQSRLRIATERILQLTRLNYAAAYLLEGDKLRLWAAAPPLSDTYPEVWRTPPLADHPHIMQAINSREYVLLHDMQHAELSVAERELAALFDLRTALFLPLTVGDKALGVLTVTSAGQPVEIGAEMLGVCRTLCNIAAIAANNALLFRDIELHSVELERRIAERDRAESQLRKLSLAVEQSPNTIVITDLEAHIEYVNAAFCKVTGYSREEAIGQNPRILQSGKTPQSLYQDMWSYLARGETWRGELINRRRDGSEFIESTMISPVRQTDGSITHYLAIKEDITEKRLAEERIQNLVHFDQLTGLPNRSFLNERFKYVLSLAQRNDEKLAVMFLDLDHFKDINDTLGHSVGDQLLVEIALRLKAHLRNEDTVARLGGDEFILVLPGNDEIGAARVATKLLEAVSQPSKIEGHELIVTPSIGIAIYPDDGEDFEELLKNADTAMYRVKQDTHNNYRFFKQEMQTHSARTLLLANALRHALARNELFLRYQPQITLEDGHVIGAEALLRWEHPELGAISPAEFIPIAEASGQIIPIGEWVLRTAAAQLKAWMDNGSPPMTMAVNLSAAQFRQPGLTAVVTKILDEIKLPHRYLELELTEAVAMDDPEGAIAVMDELYASGLRMSIDDFGTGYSSLSYLKRFKVSKLKIDQSFVHDISHDADDKAIVTAIINMASSLGIHTIAEGVETAGQLAFLRLQGCDEVQGYYFSKPLPAEEFEAFLRK